MISMAQIVIEGNTINFGGIENIQKGVTVFISAGNVSVYIVSKTSTAIENWLSLIVATFNVQENKDVTAILNNKIITLDGASAIEMDLGFDDA